MISATQLRVGMIILHKDGLCRIIDVLHITPGNKRGLVQTKMKNILTNAQVEHKFRSDDKVERAILDQRNMEYLYSEKSHHVFMDSETYEQIYLDDDVLEGILHYLVPNVMVKMDFYNGKSVGIELPKTVDLRVISTDPEMKGVTATNSPKPATLETGLVVQVPQFIKEGDVIKVETSEGVYLERT
ncbi:MAG: elongation factor P [Thermodesulfobacteriota bacterium]|nr:elongation factor P [Thermodesulfobacteriota bacterium]